MCVSQELQWEQGSSSIGRTVGFNTPSMRMTLEYWGKAEVMEAQLANRVSPLKRNMLQGNMNAKDTLCGEFSVGFGGLDILLPASSPWIPSKHI